MTTLTRKDTFAIDALVDVIIERFGPAGIEHAKERLSVDEPTGMVATMKKVKRAVKMNGGGKKRPLSSYIVYCNKHRDAVRASLSKDGGEGADPKLVTKTLAANWGKLTPEQKAEYVDAPADASTEPAAPPAKKKVVKKTTK